MSKISLSIIVPCYNEEKNIAKFYNAIMGEDCAKIPDESHALSRKSQKNSREIPRENSNEIPPRIPHNSPKIPRKQTLKAYKYEIIFVDDGSKDGTIAQIRALQAIDKHIRLIKFSRNFGKESAMLAGLRAAKNLLSAIMDCDLQDPPELLFKMIEMYKNSGGELKMITARRKNRDGEGIIRKFLSNSFYAINNLFSSVRLESGVRDFRLIHRDALKAILAMNEYHRFSKAIFEFVGFTRQSVEFDYVAREDGKSSWNLLKLFKYGVGGIISFSTAPLKIISIIGILIFIFSGIWGAKIIIETLIFGNPVKGYPSLVVFISFFGGLQIVMLGIIGEYIAKIYEQGKNRPHYFIEYED